MYRRALLVLVGGAFLIAGGCQGEAPSGGSSSDLLVVPVSLPVEDMVQNHEEFTGRTNAIEVVDIRARVTGYLNSMPFREGAFVRQGQVLFEVDPQPYQAQLDQANSQVKLNDASLKLAKSNLVRDLAINDTVNNGVSQLQVETDKATVEEAQARYDSSVASTKVYKLNLDFCSVRSPIDGQVSRYYITRGNLVNQDQTLLTTIVSVDKMFGYFDMDEPTVIRINRAIAEGRLSKPDDGAWTVYLGLSNEPGFPHKGTLDFLNNQLNSATGSRSMRGVFDNPLIPQGLPTLAASTFGLLASPHGAAPLLPLRSWSGVKGTRFLTPGMFVRIRLPIGEPSKALLIKDQFILADLGNKYVYVLDKDNKVEQRRITTGMLLPNGLRVVEGIKADEWVVTGAIQQVRPKMQVKRQEREMPTLGNADNADKETGPDKGTRGQGDKGTKTAN